MQQLVFVPTDGAARISSEEQRQLIRRHCMQGKNKRPDSRRSKREAARKAASGAARPVSAPGPVDVGRAGDSKLISTTTTSRDGPYVQCGDDDDDMLSSRNCHWLSRVARPPSSNWTLYPFPIAANTADAELMHDYIMHNPVRDMLYPFDHFGMVIDFDTHPAHCDELLFADSLSRHGILVMTSASRDLLLRQPLSTSTRAYVRRMIRRLNAQLSLPDAHRDDMVLYVISILACVAVMFHEYDAARAHSEGIRAILRMRGDWGTGTSTHPSVQFSVDRVNFVSALTTTRWEPIYSSSVWGATAWPTEVCRLYDSLGMLRLERLLPSERGRPNHDNNDVGHHQTGTPSQYNEFRGQHSPQKTSSDIHDTTDDYQQLVQTFRHLQLFTVYMNRHHAEGTPLDGALVRSSQGISLSCIIELDRRHQAMARAAAAVSTSSSSESPLLTTTARQPDGDGQAQVEQLLRQRTLLARCLVLGISMMAFLAACFRLPRVVLPPDHGCCRHEPGHDRNLRGEFLQAYIEVLAVDVESGATAAREDSGGRVVTTWADDPGTTMRVGRSRDGSLAVFGHEARLEMWLLLMLQMSDTHGNHHHHNHYRDNQARCRQHQYGDPVSPGSTAPGPTANTQEQAESVVRHAWRRLVTDRGLSWEDVRAQVRQVIWMEAFFDGLGGPAFEALSRSVMEAYIAGG